MAFGYKKKQGLIVRWGFFIAVAALFIFGVFRLYADFPDPALKGKEWWEWSRKVFFEFEIPGIEVLIQITPRLIISAVAGIFSVLLVLYLCFQNQRVSDFLIDTESEMKKVSWPTMQEVFQSSIVVIISIIVLGLYLFLIDKSLGYLFHFIFFYK